jgi:hypothetical protein
LRNQLSPLQRRAIRIAASRRVGALLSFLARRSGVAPVHASWRLLNGPTFDNAIGELELNERAANATISCSSLDEAGAARLQVQHAITL